MIFKANATTPFSIRSLTSELTNVSNNHNICILDTYDPGDGLSTSYTLFHLIFRETFWLATINMSTLQMRKLRLREVSGLQALWQGQSLGIFISRAAEPSTPNWVIQTT